MSVTIRKRLLLVLIGAVLALMGVAGPGTQRAVAQEDNPILEGSSACDTSLRRLIDGAQPGATVEVPACLYRESITVDKPITLNAAAGAEIRGSDVWSAWRKTDKQWLSKAKVPDFYTHGECDEGTERCLWAEQVFLDGQPLKQVAAKPRAGQFAVDRSRRIVLGQNPSGHEVEVTTRTEWILGAADDVTVEGFRMRHSANDAQTGAIDVEGHSNWTIRDNVLSDAHGTVVVLNDGRENALVDNDIFRGGQQGVSGNGTGNLVQNNEIHDNNTEGFSSGWEAGGLKMALAEDLTLDANEVYGNKGPGLWCDIDCKNVTYGNNRVHHNANAGIFFEISDGAKIHGNKVWENGWGYSDWGWGTGILISSSKNAEVYDNIVAWNADGISVISQKRPADFGADRGRWNRVTNNNVHDNRIFKTDDDPNDPEHDFVFSLAWMQDWNGAMYESASNNRGSNNLYWYPAATEEYMRFSWLEGYDRLSDFNATPGEENGRYVSDPEKDQALSSANVPLSPEPR